jgi:hypothetical protein
MDHNVLGEQLFDAMRDCMMSLPETQLTAEFVENLNDGDWVYFYTPQRLICVGELCRTRGITITGILVDPAVMFNRDNRPDFAPGAKFDAEWMFNYFLEAVKYVAHDMDQLSLKE